MVVIFLFVAIVALVWIIIYGGIQPDGLVLAVHKITVDTSKTHRPVVDPNLSTPSPTTYSTPRPIRGTVPPRSKWGPYDRYRPRPNDMIERTTAHHEMAAQNEILVENWAKKVFDFKNFKKISSFDSKRIITTTKRSETFLDVEENFVTQVPFDHDMGNENTEARTASSKKILTQTEIIMPIQTTTTKNTLTFESSDELDSSVLFDESKSKTFEEAIESTLAPSGGENASKSNAQNQTQYKTYEQNDTIDVSNTPISDESFDENVSNSKSLEQLLMSTLERLAEHYKNSTK